MNMPLPLYRHLCRAAHCCAPLCEPKGCVGMLQAVEKLVLSKLLVEGSNRRIFNVDHHAGMVSSLVAAAVTH